VAVSGDAIVLKGDGASPRGDIPFVDRLSLSTGRKERIFQSDPEKFQELMGLLDSDGSRLLIRSESPSEPPNYFIRDASGKMTAVTNFSDPAPQLRSIRKQLVTYKRPDGVPLSFTLYLPPGYREGTRLPAFLWAYPREYNDSDTAGQISGSLKRFDTLASYRLLLLAGYALIDNATMPVVGDPETVNNTYIEQIVASAKAAIGKASEMGFVDPDRVAVGGHSYGGFMTANLLAHSDLFRAGLAESGAYNRTLTPFSFQTERRTLWEAPEIYLRMSPFMYADKIKEPLLLIHGEADNNQGTFPIQSDRMYQAVRGNGGTVRLVFLPFESHGYAAQETIEHVLAEQVDWLDKYVKNAPRLTSSQQ
jgi:dipeptidyl aminopeptidase/acylaminoacyl peptidase